MASVSKIFKPRRGLASTMAGSGKKNIVLQKGEFFLEAPSGGMGTGASKVKVGDGTTAYSSLPYALGDTSNDKIDFSNNTSTTVANALTSVASGKALKTIIGGLKQAISLCNTSITKLNDDTSNIKTYIGTDGLIHFTNKDGADTVLNFNKGTDISNLSGILISTNTKSVKIVNSLCGILVLARYIGWHDFFYYKNGNKILVNVSTSIGNSSGKSSYFGTQLIIENFEKDDIFSITTNADGDIRIIGLS